MKQSSLGFGVVGALDMATVQAIARKAEEIGLASLWFNDTPGGDSLARLEAAAAVTDRLQLASGVISVDRKPAARIVEEVKGRGLPQERLVIGIGSAAGPSPLRRVEESLGVLAEDLSARTVVGSLGPRMRRLGAEKSNGLLFNWLPPRFAAETTREMREQARIAGNTPVMSATYIRTALGTSARSRLVEEAERYAAIPAYAANFQRLGIDAMDSVVYAEDPAALRKSLLAYDGTVDHAIVRAITASDDLEHYLALLEAIAPIA